MTPVGRLGGLEFTTHIHTYTYYYYYYYYRLHTHIYICMYVYKLKGWCWRKTIGFLYINIRIPTRGTYIRALVSGPFRVLYALLYTDRQTIPCRCRIPWEVLERGQTDKRQTAFLLLCEYLLRNTTFPFLLFLHPVKNKNKFNISCSFSQRSSHKFIRLTFLPRPFFIYFFKFFALRVFLTTAFCR